MDFFKNLGFKKFQEFAKNKNLSDSMRVGFPDDYRKGKEESILEDILGKLTNLRLKGKNFLDIGPGASQLTELTLDFCKKNNHSVVFVDSKEMLDLVSGAANLSKVEACFPEKFDEIKKTGPYDAILSYSVLQYPFAEGNVWSFVDRLCLLLNNGGQLLLGDIPNISMRKRFFSSESGLKYHQEFTHDSTQIPNVSFNQLEIDQIDDGVLLGILTRLRASGYHAFILPQNCSLPFSNRREDILIVKP